MIYLVFTYKRFKNWSVNPLEVSEAQDKTNEICKACERIWKRLKALKQMLGVTWVTMKISSKEVVAILTSISEIENIFFVFSICLLF